MAIPNEERPSLMAEAVQVMGDLGIDPESPQCLLELALELLWERRLLTGRKVPGKSGTREIDNEAWSALQYSAGYGSRIITKLKLIEQKYLQINRPTESDVRIAAISCLSDLDASLEGVGAGQVANIPTPLFMILIDLQNVEEGHDGRLFSRKIKARGDSPSDYCRRTIIGYATDAVRRLVAKNLTVAEACERVASILEENNFFAPGGNKSYSAKTLRTYFDAARAGNAKFQREYQIAGLSRLDLTPEELLKALGKTVRLLMFRQT